MEFLTRFFTWWNGATIGTLFYTSRHGVKVGEDEAGNVFYQSKDGKRRWVIYNGVAEASRVSPEWHGWLHRTWDEPPSKAPLKHKAWEKPHRANPTGTAEAWHLPGSLMTPQTRPHVAGDYEAWRPE